MFGFITRAVFGLDVSEKNGVIRISGIRADLLIEDINKTFGTSRVTVHMLNKATRSYVEFYSFFAIDVEYIIRQLSKQSSSRLGRRGYVKMQEALLQKTWLSGLTKIHPSIFNKDKLKEVKFELLKHQAEFIDYYDRVIPRYNLRGILMAATPGSGKTISAIAIACAFEADNVIIVGPKNSVFRVWEKTLLEDMNVEQTVWVQASKKPMPDPSTNRWYIFHYESLDKAVELANKLGSKKCVVVLDESHNLNEMKSLRTERFVTMCKSMRNSLVVELSGTPMKAMGAEAIPLISAIDPLFTDACVEKFKKIYGREAKSATAILANRLGIIMYKVNKEESKIAEPVEHAVNVKVPNSHLYTLDTIKKDMTAFIEQRTLYYKNTRKTYESIYYGALKQFESNQIVFLKHKDQYETYKTYIKEFAKYGYDPYSSAPKALFCNEFEKKIIQPVLEPKTRKDFRSAKSVVKYVDLKIRGECLGTVLSRARTNCNMAILQALDLGTLIDGAEKKTLIFTSYVEIVKATSEKLKTQGYSPLSVFAETNAQLPQMVRQFGENEEINPMIATYQSLSTAVPLIMANRVILLNSPFRIHEKEQTVARANRLGQDKTVDVYNVLLDTGDVPNISTRSSDIMEWSREQVNAIMGFDNSENGISIESIHEDECLDDMSSLTEDDEVISIENKRQDVRFVGQIDGDVGVNNDIKKQDKTDMKSSSIPRAMGLLFNELNTSVNFLSKISDNLDKGFTMSMLSLEMYRILNPLTTTVSLESHGLTSVQRTIVSMEEEKSRTKTIILKLIELLMAFVKSVWAYLTDANKKCLETIEACKELKSHIASGRSRAFAKAHGNVKVTSANWLSRGAPVTPVDYVKQLKWQTDASLKVVDVLTRDFSELSKSFEKRVEQISSQPGLNQMTAIMNELAKFNMLIIDGKSKKYDTTTENVSSVFIGGKQFKLRMPNHGDSADLIANFSAFRITSEMSTEFNVESEQEVEALNKGQAELVIDMIIDNNKKMSSSNTFFKTVEKNVERFNALTKRVTESNINMNEQQQAIYSAQISVMVAGIKGVSSIAKDFARINELTSKAAIGYVTSSARGYIEPVAAASS